VCVIDYTIKGFLVGMQIFIAVLVRVILCEFGIGSTVSSGMLECRLVQRCG
jgi:hypothetical protein